MMYAHQEAYSDLKESDNLVRMWIVFVVWPLVYIVGGISSVGAERILATYWSRMSTFGKFPIWVAHIGNTGYAIGVIIIGIVEWSGDVGRPDYDLLQPIALLLTPYICALLASLCVAIRESFLGVLKDGVPLSVIYDAYSSIRCAIDDVSRAIVYATIILLAMTMCMLLTLLASFIEGRSDFGGTPAIIFFAILLLSLLSVLSYPSHLVDKGDLEMREIVVNSKDRDNAHLLTCLFLDNDISGIRFFGIVFNRETLTFWSRVIYISISYLLTRS